MKIIQKRIGELKDIIKLKFSSENKQYTDLTEFERISFRSIQAQIVALEDFIKGEDIRSYLKICVNEEHYCGAEGVKNAIEWIKNNYIILQP